MTGVAQIGKGSQLLGNGLSPKLGANLAPMRAVTAGVLPDTPVAPFPSFTNRATLQGWTSIWGTSFPAVITRVPSA